VDLQLGETFLDRLDNVLAGCRPAEVKLLSERHEKPELTDSTPPPTARA
jgi:hypothetical protein